MKILMALMGLEIGGAETHVVELSKELKKMGHSVAIVSAGGAYLPEIQAVGIKHYYAPLMTRKPLDMLKAYVALKKAVRTEKPDIVHAHARIPAFLCHLVSKTDKSFAFVTSVHGMFTPTGLMGKLSRWGSYQLAVSEDLKRYVVQNYKKVREENVYVSVNGIDTEKFGNTQNGDSVIEEFGLNPDATRLVYVSRLDKDGTMPVLSLFRILPELLVQIPNLEVIIVGGGSELEALKSQADFINRTCSRRAVVLTGARTDVARINACATFCIGVSRSILEAMSESKPVILASSFGYMGIFTPDKLSTAVSNNFTCRATAELNDRALYEDILTLYSMDKESRASLGAYCREVVIERYSSRKMAYDNLKMYTKAVNDGKYDVAILGYYGFRNSGDDALLQAIISSLRARKPDIRISVFSKKPEETASIYKVSSVNRFDWSATRKVLKNTKLFIMGGGSLLQDGTSMRSLYYYVYMLCTAKKKCQKTMLYANGLGPFVHNRSKKLVKKALSDVDIITLRDADSALDLEKLGLHGSNVFVTADPVFSLSENSTADAFAHLEKRGITDTDKYICVSPRRWCSQPDEFSEGFAKMCDYIVNRYGYKIVFLPMQYPYDAKIIRSVQARMKNPSVFVDSRLSPGDTLAIIRKSDMTIGVRLHLLIYASTVAVPGIGIVYDPKVSSFQRYIGQPYFIDPRALAAGDYTSVIDECIRTRLEISASLAQSAEQMKAKSEQTADMAIKLIEG